MDLHWLAFAPLFLMFIVPFLFKIKKYEDVEIIDKQKEINGMFIEYLFVVKAKDSTLTLTVSKDVYKQLHVGSIASLYYNTGDEKVTSYSVN